MTDRDCWIGFSVFPGIGPRRFQALLKYFGTAELAWNATASDLRATKLGDTLTASFDLFRKSFDVTSYQKKLDVLQVRVVLKTDPEYPPSLQEISDAPFLLYVRGNMSLTTALGDRAIAVVGTRHMTPYGEAAVQKIVPELVLNDCSIVSGMAYGVDAAAHWEAIHAGVS